MIQRLDRHTDPEPVWNAIKAASGKRAFEIGANIGQAARIMHRGFEEIIAFEPCLESYEILAKESTYKVTAVLCAVSDHDGELVLQEAATSISTGQLVSHEGLHWGPLVGTRTVPCLTLDTLSVEYGPPDFIKIDTEGHEVEVVRGGSRVFTAKPTVVIEVHRQENEAPLRELLPHYDLVKVEHWGLRPHSPIRQNHFWLCSKELMDG